MNNIKTPDCFNPFLNHLLAKLDNIKPNGSGHTARCPAHDDNRNSLSISEKENRILLHCHAGCKTEDICAALGIEVKDLFSDPVPVRNKGRNRPYGREVATYDYQDENGKLLFQCVKYEPKDFRQRRPDGNGGWIWNLDKTRRVLYRLPELLKADPGKTVLICEGEKDANRLKSLGLIATTNPQGAGKWKDEYSDILRGRKVVILADNDDPGRNHAEAVARSLWGKAESIRILNLPNLPIKGDVSTWLDNGGTKEKLISLAKDTAEYEPSQAIVESWPDPLPIPSGLPPVANLDPDMLPESFKGWIMDSTERMQVPPDFHAAAAIVAIGSLIGRRCGIYPKARDSWLVIPNLWGVSIGTSGIMKTHAIKEGFYFLKRLASSALKNIESDLLRYETEDEIYTARLKAYRSTLEKGARKGNLIETDKPIPPDKPKPRRYMTSDPTVEKLAELLRDNPNGLLLFRDELPGFLRNLEKQGREGDRAFYLESWDGLNSFAVDRIGRGSIQVPALCLSIFGGIQPGPLSEYVSKTYQGAAGNDGLLQRFQVSVWPDLSPDWKNEDRCPNQVELSKAESIFERLNDPTFYPPSCENIPSLRFNESGQEVFDSWRENLEKRLRSGELPPILESHLAKYRSLMPSLALIFDLVDSKSFPESISELAALRAVSWTEYLETHARRVYGLYDPESQAARELAERIKKGQVTNGMTFRELSRTGWSSLTDPDLIRFALDTLAELNWIRVDRAGPGSQGGRPSEIIRINPGLELNR